MSSTTITVIVPVYNRAHIVTRTLDSIAAQQVNTPLLQLIIVDNNSTDDTLNVVEQWAKAHRSATFLIDILTESTPGAAAARNRGLVAADSTHVMFFDSDDTMPPGMLTSVINAFDSRPGTDIVVWGIDIELSDGTLRTLSPLSTSHPWFDAIVHGKLSTLRYAARRQLFGQAGGWNPTVRVWDDMELGVRLLLLNPTIEPLQLDQRPRTTYTPDSITASAATSRGFERMLHSLEVCRHDMINAGRHDLIKWIDYRQAILAADIASQGNRAMARKALTGITAIPSWLTRLIYTKHRIFTRGTYLLMPYRRP